YYFCDKVVLHVTPRPIKKIETKEIEIVAKPRVTFATVKAYRERGFISPLSHGAKASEQNSQDDNKVIEKLVVKFGEGPTFFKCENQEMTLCECNRLCWLALIDQRNYVRENGEGYGYDKVFLSLTLKSGQVVDHRFDLAIKRPSLAADWSNYVDYFYE
ncbi:hypothetical protein ABXV21_25840, partial [Vibrio harveyi]